MKVVITDSFVKSFNDMFSIRNRIRSLFYDLKNSIRNLYKYFNVVVGIRTWDYNSILEIMKIQIGDLKKSIETKSLEVDETKQPKIDDMNRCLELIDNILNDEYYERCGWKPSEKSFDELFKKDEKTETYEYVGDDKYSDEEFKEISYNARKLENSEIEELFNKMKNIKSWWW